MTGRELIDHWRNRQSLWWDEVAQAVVWSRYPPNPDWTNAEALATTSDYSDSAGLKIWEGGGWSDETLFFLALPPVAPTQAREAASMQESHFRLPQFIPC
jgi:hypothetical protein